MHENIVVTKSRRGKCSYTPSPFSSLSSRSTQRLSRYIYDEQSMSMNRAEIQRRIVPDRGDSVAANPGFYIAHTQSTQSWLTTNKGAVDPEQHQLIVSNRRCYPREYAIGPRSGSLFVTGSRITPITRCIDEHCRFRLNLIVSPGNYT